MKPNVEIWARENRIDPSSLVDGKLDEFLSELGYKYSIRFKILRSFFFPAYTLVRCRPLEVTFSTFHFAASIDSPCDDFSFRLSQSLS